MSLRLSKTTIALFTFPPRALSALLAFTTLACICLGVANAQVSSVDGVTVLHIQGPQSEPDFVNAKPMPLPSNPVVSDPTQSLIQALLNPPPSGPSGYSPGAQGTGAESPVFLGTPAGSGNAENNSGILPDDFGTAFQPFTTVRADLFGLNTNTAYPYSAAGKMFFAAPKPTWCSASLIAPGIIVTAAHCVAPFGQNRFFGGWVFAPGYRFGAAPFGAWGAIGVFVLNAWLAGTDPCTVPGVVCQDDVAVIALNGLPGNAAGFLGFAFGTGFTPGPNLAQITQLGYPAGLDFGLAMERNDSFGYISVGLSNNTIIGSNMNGGSSGGPWAENLGLPATLTGETNGAFPFPNIVVGVTSWGYTNLAVKQMGASPFTAGNINALFTAACLVFPGNC
jgi:hypothetical protein